MTAMIDQLKAFANTPQCEFQLNCYHWNGLQWTAILEAEANGLKVTIKREAGSPEEAIAEVTNALKGLSGLVKSIQTPMIAPPRSTGLDRLDDIPY